MLSQPQGFIDPKHPTRSLFTRLSPPPGAVR
jgi:hypothetical protein